jgi:GNAT superfamily N-acetyltransferase
MTTEGLTISRGLAPDGRRAAAEIYYLAFRRKLSPILGGPETAVALLERCLNPDRALVALIDQQVVGLVGLHHRGQQFVSWRLAELSAQFGWWLGMWRYALSALFVRKPQEATLMMDGIAVAPAMQGRGIGRQLLEAVASFGREHGYRAVGLSVVDSNPDARRLYERVGFTAGQTERYPFMRPFGFSEVTHMVLPLN